MGGATSRNGSFPRVLSGPEDYYFHTDGSFSVTLPVGTAELEVWRGFEYEPVAQTVDVRAGEWTNVDVRLERWIDMAADGWYSGGQSHSPELRRPLFRHPRSTWGTRRWRKTSMWRTG